MIVLDRAMVNAVKAGLTSGAVTVDLPDHRRVENKEDELQQFQNLLDNWSVWYAKPLPLGSEVTSTLAKSSAVFDEVTDEHERNTLLATAVDACLSSLTRLQQLSIEFYWVNRKCNAAVFSHPLLPSDYQERLALYCQSKNELLKVMKRRNLI